MLMIKKNIFEVRTLYKIYYLASETFIILYSYTKLCRTIIFLKSLVFGQDSTFSKSFINVGIV